MNLTINSKNNNVLKQIKGHYIAAACGITLAASAVLAATPWQGGTTHTATQGYTSPAASRQGTDASVMASVLSTEHATYAFAETSAVAPARQASEADIMASVISTEHATYVFEAQADVPASQPVIMDSVLSTEHATWYFTD